MAKRFVFTEDVKHRMEATLQQEFGIEVNLKWTEKDGGSLTASMLLEDGLSDWRVEAINARMAELIDIEKDYHHRR